jgi:O-antigen/teichoic acid export membrane protein
VAALCAMLLWQLQDTLRTGFIANLEQRRALVGDALSYGGQALLLGLMCSGTKPSLEAIFWTLGGTSLAALVVQIWQIRPLMPPRRVVGPLVCTFWTLGRWNVVAKLMGFLTLQAFPWLILMRHGRVEVAGFQVIFQFLAFINPLLYSMGSMVTATVAKTQSFRGSTVRNYLILTVAATSSYLLFLAVAGSFAMGALYGSHSHYVGYAPLMSIFAAAWFFEVIALLTTSILAGLGRPRGIFTVQLNGALAAVLIVLPWTYWKGLIAAALGMLLVNAVRASTGVVLLLGHREATPAPRPLRLSPDFSMDADVNEVTLGQQLGTTLQEEYVEP